MTDRQWAQRKLKQAIDNLSWAGKHLDDISERYMDLHPEIATDITLIQTGIEFVQDGITTLGNTI
jgi:hypothetical protein